LELNMGKHIDQGGLHRTAKYFMDSGRAETHEDAIALLKQFGLTIHVGQELSHSIDHQVALLTLVNVARRTLLGGIEVVGLPDAICRTPLAPGQSLIDAVRELGGIPVTDFRPDWPSALIGDAETLAPTLPSWRLTWEGWRGGVIPRREHRRLSERITVPLVPALAAAACAAEAFAFHAGDHPMAGRRSLGLSLWRPAMDWLSADPTEPALAYLPSRLWIIGLGNLAQAFAWLLACLPYPDPHEVHVFLQDFDRMRLPMTARLSCPSSRMSGGANHVSLQIG